MKVYVHEKGVVLVGKAWEIKQKLLEYQCQFKLLKDWTRNVNENKDR